MKKLVSALILAMLFSVLLQAQVRDINPLKDIRGGVGTQFNGHYLFNLLPIQNFKMNHQLSASFATTGNQSVVMNSYMNTMLFEFKFPLMVRVDLGIASFPYISSDYYGDIKNQLFGQISMQYHPTKNLMMGLTLSKGPNFYYPYWSNPGNYSPVHFFNEN